MPTALATPDLSRKESRSLVNAINAGVSDVRSKLLKLHDGKGWKALGYDSWQACVEAEFVFDRTYAHRLMEAARIEQRVLPIGNITESHARELAVVPEDKQRAVYESAVKSAGKSRLTAGHIKETVAHMGLAPNRWGPRATASNMCDYLEALDNLTAPQIEVVLRKCLASVPSRILFKAIDDARYMTTSEQFEFNEQAWSTLVS